MDVDKDLVDCAGDTVSRFVDSRVVKIDDALFGQFNVFCEMCGTALRRHTPQLLLRTGVTLLTWCRHGRANSFWGSEEVIRWLIRKRRRPVNSFPTGG